MKNEKVLSLCEEMQKKSGNDIQVCPRFSMNEKYGPVWHVWVFRWKGTEADAIDSFYPYSKNDRERFIKAASEGFK